MANRRPSKPKLCRCEGHISMLEEDQCSRCGHAVVGEMVYEVLERSDAYISASTARTAIAIAQVMKRTFD